MHLTSHRVSFPLGSHLGASGLATIFLFSAGAPRSFAQTATASAATSATGSISGRVQNEATGLYLNNARISVKGTNLDVLTDEFGSFRILGDSLTRAHSLFLTHSRRPVHSRSRVR